MEIIDWIKYFAILIACTLNQQSNGYNLGEIRRYTKKWLDHHQNSKQHLSGLLEGYLNKAVSPWSKVGFEIRFPSNGGEPIAKYQYPTGCGRKSHQSGHDIDDDDDLGPRIRKGRVTEKGEWPWMAAILTEDDGFVCGGALISDRHIVTAAHCVDKSRPDQVTVILGHHDFAAEQNDARRDAAVGQIIMHDRYLKQGAYSNDIAILRLASAVPFNSYISPICIPAADLHLDDKDAVVTGWGEISEKGAQSSVLLEVTLPIWKQSHCVTMAARKKLPKISDSQLCAGYKQGMKDACRGDSGGPLMLTVDGGGQWVIVGVVSFGKGCGRPSIPGIYTRTSAYRDWILSNIKTN